LIAGQGHIGDLNLTNGIDTTAGHYMHLVYMKTFVKITRTWIRNGLQQSGRITQYQAYLFCC